MSYDAMADAEGYGHDAGSWATGNTVHLSGPDTCPTFMGWHFHRWPCPRAGEIGDLIARTAPAHRHDQETTAEEAEK